MMSDEVEVETLRTALGYTEVRRLCWKKGNPEGEANVITDWRAFLKEYPFGSPWDIILKSGECVETGRCTFVDGETMLEGDYIFWARAWAVRLRTPERYNGFQVNGHLVKYNPSSYWRFDLNNVYAEMRKQVLAAVRQ